MVISGRPDGMFQIQLSRFISTLVPLINIIFIDDGESSVVTGTIFPHLFPILSPSRRSRRDITVNCASIRPCDRDKALVKTAFTREYYTHTNKGKIFCSDMPSHN